MAKARMTSRAIGRAITRVRRARRAMVRRAVEKIIMEIHWHQELPTAGRSVTHSTRRACKGKCGRVHVCRVAGCYGDHSAREHSKYAEKDKKAE